MNRQDEHGHRITGFTVRRTWPDGRSEVVYSGDYHINSYATAVMVAQKIRDAGGTATVRRVLAREDDIDAHLQNDPPPRTPPRGERGEDFDERPTWEDAQ